LRFSRVTVPTLKEKPAEAEIPSHELLLRAGMIRATASGVYTMLPLGSRALARVESMVREEMNSAGALEIVLPTIHPSDPWEKSGRWEQYGPEMMRVTDRAGRWFCLGPTAEEIVTDLVGRSTPSYRDLPVNLYQIQTKFRDEIRPRFGLLRCREFRMKDAYSFHTDESDLDETYRMMYDAYVRVSERCALDVRVVEAATGLIGGDVSHEFMVVSDVGEDLLVYCESCDYGANAELEAHRPSGAFGGGEECPLEEVRTPGMVSVEDVASYLSRDARSVLKCVLYVVGNEVVAVFVPGYRDVSEAKLSRVLRTDDFHPLREDERAGFPAVTAGFTGPVGLEGVTMIFDREVAGTRGLVCGANKPEYHLIGVQEGRDFTAEPCSDIATAVEGDLCVECGSNLKVARGVEIGHIFKLGTKYSRALGAEFADSGGELKPMVMGTYGIGTSRLMATVVEQHHDRAGIKWPSSVAPLPLELIVIGPDRRDRAAAAGRLTEELENRGLEVLLDDREVSPGVKFNDADLVGLPVQVVVGNKLDAEGVVDIKVRYTGERREAPAQGAVEDIERAISEAP
jgi:prolyl-tRNA synthetase